jgi:RimJ/RimL family protein N-acetyltransferase
MNDLQHARHRLESERLVLRPLEVADCNPRYVAWLANPEVNQWLETRWREQDLASVRAFVASVDESPDAELFAIVRREDDLHLGNIKLGPVNWNHRCGDISYFLGERDAWGRGYATEAIRRLVAFAFGDLDLHRLQAGCYEGNRGSARVLEKVGFTREGSWRKQLKGPDGRWQDHWWFGLLAEEYKP